MTVMHNKVLIEEENTEVHPECVPMKCLDQNVCMPKVRSSYFTTDAWELVQNVLKMMRETRMVVFEL